MTGQRESRGVDQSLVDSTIDEEVCSNKYPSSEDQTTALKEEQAAADVLRKRLKAVLRPDLSSDGLHQIEMMQYHEEEMRPASVTGWQKNSREKAVKHLPSMGIRKVSSQWDDENPFQVSTTTAIGSKAGAVAERDIHSIPRHMHEDSAEQGGTGSFVDVALASTSASNTECHTRHPPSSAKSQPVSAVHSSGSVPSHSANKSSLAFDSTRPSMSRSPSSDNGASSLPIVVARAECELAHPRPSRSSESRMLKVLVKGKEGNVEQQGGEGTSHTRRQQSVPSQESATSFHTAQQSDQSER